MNMSNPLSFIWMFLGSIFSISLMGQGILHFFKRKIQLKSFEELHLRIRTWSYILAVIAIAFYFQKTGILWFFGLMSFIAFKEFISVMPGRSQDRRTLFWAYIAIPLQYYFIAQNFFVLSLIFLPIHMFLFISIRLVLTGATEGFLRSLSSIQWGVLSMVYCLSHSALFLIQQIHQPYDLAKRLLLILFLLFLTESSDIAQYTVGKLFGRKKILPRISPKKTWAGFLGGILFCLCICIGLGPKLLSYSYSICALMGLMFAVVGFFGDVTLSAIKRDLKIKDTSTFLPGHGGVIDRIDSLIFTAPAFFHFVNYFGMPA